MQFCNISEAWGNDAISQNYYKNYNSVTEKFSPLTSNQTIIPKNKHLKNFNSCDEIISHVIKCKYCSKKIREKLFGNMYNNIRNAIFNYQEPIVLVLITIFIVLLVNLILKMD